MEETGTSRDDGRCTLSCEADARAHPLLGALLAELLGEDELLLEGGAERAELVHRRQLGAVRDLASHTARTRRNRR